MNKILYMLTSLSLLLGINQELARLWSKYESAERADKPADMVAALEQIRSEAESRRLDWDYYDASVKWIAARSRMDWKLSSESRKKVAEDFARYDSPVINLVSKTDIADYESYALENRKLLESACNTGFYNNLILEPGYGYWAVIAKQIKNDYEFALWYGLKRKSQLGELGRHYAGVYPQEAVIAFEKANREKDAARTAALESVYEKYKDKAASLLPAERLLMARFAKLESAAAGEKEYLALYQDCKAYEKKRASYVGDEKQLVSYCFYVKNLIDRLEAKDVNARIDDDKLILALRNVPSLNVLIYPASDERHPVFKSSLKNPDSPFYVFDTVKVDLPVLDDGRYVVKLEGYGQNRKLDYERTSLSIALRQHSSGLAAFVADSRSGEPVGSCTLKLFGSGSDTKPLSEMTYTLDRTYCPLSDQFLSPMGDKPSWRNFYVKAYMTGKDGVRRESRACYLYMPQRLESNDDNLLRCTLLTDRKVARPGEDISFKAILYRGSENLSSCPGEMITVEFADPDGKVSSLKRETDSFSSVSGSFNVGRPERSGNCQLRVKIGNKLLQNKSIILTDSELPSFDLRWDDFPSNAFSGDTITVRGLVRNYSGHPLATLRCKYTVRNWNNSVADGDVELAADGSFSVPVCIGERTGRYTFLLDVTDASGESRQFSTMLCYIPELIFNSSVVNSAPGSVRCGLEGASIICSDHIRLKLSIFYSDPRKFAASDVSFDWSIVSEKDTVLRGNSKVRELAQDVLDIDISSLPDGLYSCFIRASAQNASGAVSGQTAVEGFVKLSPDAKCLPSGISALVCVPDEGRRRVFVGASEGPLWMVTDLENGKGEVVPNGIIGPDATGKESLIVIDLDRSYPCERLKINFLWFKNRNGGNWSYEWNARSTSASLPLSFIGFRDRVSPGGEFSLILQSSPDVECAVAVYDEAMEQWASNVWTAFAPVPLRLPECRYSTAWGDDRLIEPEYVIGYGGRPRALVRGKSATFAAASMEDGAVLEEAESVSVNALPALDAGSALDPSVPQTVRDDFSEVLCWQPALRTDSEGRARLSFKASDKLSRFRVNVFAHNRKMQSAVADSSFVVTIPVRISSSVPACLYVGSSDKASDECVLPVSVSNSTSDNVRGVLSAAFYEGDDYRKSVPFARESFSVEVGGNEGLGVNVRVPACKGSRVGILLSFAPENASDAADAVFYSIELRRAELPVIEAHSALLTDDGDYQRIVDSLRAAFVNFSPDQAVVSRIRIEDMLLEAVPARITPQSDNAIDLSEAVYVAALVDKMGLKRDAADMASVLERLEKCFCADGGVSWFETMGSSQLVTAVVLERIHSIASMGLELPESLMARIPAAVKYLDKSYFAGNDSLLRDFWGLSMAQYIYVRAMYASVPFDRSCADKKQLSLFAKELRSYLAPSTERGLDGMVLAKARRLMSLQMLDCKDGARLLDNLGVRLPSARIRRSLNADIASLEQYIRPHWSGGCYCPNAVMPFRGLLESELYAHSLLCNLMDSVGRKDLADAIRLWIMVQKETQKWESDPAYIEALACVVEGGRSVLDCSVVVLEAQGVKAFEDVRKAGNEMSVEREWYLVRGAVTSPLAEGDSLSVGDRLEVRYRIWSRENRSFVHLSAPRPACVTPVQPLSGSCRVQYLSFDLPLYGRQSSYRSVAGDRSDYWLEVLPEEESVIVESFYVSASGRFVCPPVSIVSTYADHYCANDDSDAPICVQADKN